MAKFQEHFDNSFYRIRQKYPQLLIENREVICRLLTELHEWFDFFCGKEGYNTAYTLFYDREKRHHSEGIFEAIAIFTQKYGEKFCQLIEEEANAHVYDDFGEIPSQAECSRHYLREKRGW
ncbi:MAG: hypothetical protein NT116_01310 [Candidatus Parcubacteria bacterium]|nr:hypothetical protein [Candidatus Parcubacteria bacterium]